MGPRLIYNGICGMGLGSHMNKVAGLGWELDDGTQDDMGLDHKTCPVQGSITCLKNWYPFEHLIKRVPRSTLLSCQNTIFR